MSTNAEYLARAMQHLNVSGVALARELTEYREDGRESTPETVSRWLNGKLPVEPAVMAWVTERLRTKAMATPRAIVTWPKGGNLIIGVASSKGGVTVSTVAQNLAVVAHREFQLQTRHFCGGVRGDSEYICSKLRALRIDSSAVEFDEVLAYEPQPCEVVVVDVAKEISSAIVHDPSPKVRMRRFRPDVLVVPADFGSGFEVWATRDFVNAKGLNGELCLVHRPRLAELTFGAHAAENGFDVTSDLFYELIMPQHPTESEHIPPNIYNDWAASDQKHHFIGLFTHLVELAGGKLDMPTESHIATMKLPQLIDYYDVRA